MPFLAKGTYGCVFKPPIACQDQPVSQQSVGKVFEYPEAMRTEWEFLALLQSIDPRGEFTLATAHRCTTKPSFRKTDHVELCPFMRPGDNFSQILLPYGGKSLKHYLAHHKGTYTGFQKMFRRFFAIVKGVHTLHTKGYIHQDIKPENVLYHKTKFYLIDFSLMTRHTEVYHGANEGVLAATYPYFPPEYKLLALQPATSQRFVTQALTNYQFRTPDTEDTTFLELFSMVHIDVKKDLRELYKRRALLLPASPDLAYKSDVFALGITLALMYQWCGLHTLHFTRPSKKKVYVDRVQSLLRSMLCVDPMQRASMKQVHQACEAILREHP